jgi:SRSO17 transposase
VLADAVYGDYRTRRMLEDRSQPYVLAVRSNHTLGMITQEGLLHTDPAQMAADLLTTDWGTHPAGEGAKGLRLYDWARIALPWLTTPDHERWLLVRRSRSDHKALAYYFVFAPAGTDLAEMAGAAGLRWTIEECFLRAKDDLGLDHCEARSWHGWHRHMTLVMAAAAFLTKLAVELRRAAARADQTKANETSPTSV